MQRVLVGTVDLPAAGKCIDAVIEQVGQKVWAGDGTGVIDVKRIASDIRGAHFGAHGIVR